MVVDVSEIKEFRHCKRKWQLSSRNQFHVVPTVTPTAFKLGTVFHESLHKLYLGKNIEDVLNYVRDELRVTNEKDIPMLVSMVSGYNREILQSDLDRYEVLDIEWHFKFKPTEFLDEHIIAQLNDNLADVEIAGSIDMIVRDKDTNEIWGFEHKTAKNFRNDTYLWIDEQPRLYYAALKLWVAQRNAVARQTGGVEFTLGGVFINEVRKLVRTFELKRRALKYPDDDLRNFMYGLMTSVAECHKMVQNPDIPRVPSPDLMTCGMCQYNMVCKNYQYQNIGKDNLLAQFKEELKERDSDHLEEKQEVNNA